MHPLLAIGETMVLVTPEQPEPLETATGFRLDIAGIGAMRGPFPDVRFVATGGVDAANASDFLAAGARAVSFGSALAEPGQLEAPSALVTRGS